jgi:hypothetical protein
MRKSTKILGALGASAVVLSTAGVAYAYWTTTGTGTATADVSATNTAAVIHLTQVSPPTGQLLGQTVNIVATAHNPATYSQSAGAVTASPTYPDLCGSDNWIYTPATTAPVVGTLATGADSGSLTVGTLKLVDRTDANQDSCQGKQVTFTFSAAAGS